MKILTHPWLYILLLVVMSAGGAKAAAPEYHAASSGSAVAPAQSSLLLEHLHFSAQPTDSEISNARIFDEPLVPFAGEANSAENAALAAALSAYATRTSFDDFSSLTGFVSAFPRSPWVPSLLLHLGTEYYNSGYYSRALETWESSWRQFKLVSGGSAKAQADRALGELARLYSKLGRMSQLSALLDSVKDRPLEGPATQLIEAARQGLWMMQTRPESCFRCGPLALDRILTYQNPAKGANPLIAQSKSTTNGFSLLQVAELSHDLGMNYQMAFRSPRSELVLPAVVHWKSGHYAALLKRDGDRFFVQDSTFRNSVWMTAAALEEEASGYFLVPPGPLPAGWRAVAEEQARHVWGKGQVNKQNPGSHGLCDTKCGGCSNCQASKGMATYTMHTMLVSLSLNDTPIGYATPVGQPIAFTVTYSQREADQPATFYYSNLGQKWTCNWISYINDNPTSPNADVIFYMDGGGTVSFTGFNSSNQTYTVERTSHALLTKTSNASYQMVFPDGTQRIFAMSDGSVGTSRRIFLTQLIDPTGNYVQLNYDSQLRITNITDVIGQSTTLFYTNAAYPYAITEVMDPFGRAAFFQYNSAGRLAQITDVLGLTSQFAYGANDFISSMMTPYGPTTFATGVTNGVTWLQATDPLGENELLEFNDNTPIPSVDPLPVVPHGMGALDNYLIYRNSLFWDKKAYLEGAGDITKARIYHFLHEVDINTEAPILESFKAPLENRVWFTYTSQTAGNIVGPSASPSFVGRVLDDGTTQVLGYQYNQVGNITNATDSAGRNFSSVYASNGVDLLETRMTHNGKNELLLSSTYNTQHRPLTVTDAAGQTTTNTWNARGQLLSTTDPLGEKATFTYDNNGYLLTVTGRLQAANDVISFAYDAFGRPRTITNTDGYTFTFDYDAMDRPTRLTHPDGTFEQYVYDRLDLVASRDRLGRWTTNTYNADRQLVQTRDPQGRSTSYGWCKCGALVSVTDPMGRTTTWDYDIESRLTAKHYPDGSTVTYSYENTTSRLRNRRDQSGQDTFYEYYGDDNLKRISYPNATIPTPAVSYTYDPDYNRVLTMLDGVGMTTYAYVPVSALGAGKLASISGPLPNSALTLQYDQLSRVTNRAINGVGQALRYDVLGRPFAATNSLGAFQFVYDNATMRLLSAVFPNGQTNLYSYYDNLGDNRLKHILHLKPDGSLLSGVGYNYSPDGQVTGWTNEWDNSSPRVWIPSRDAADQITNIVSLGGHSSVTNYTYTYDPAGNRLLAATNATQLNFTYNALNQILGGALAPGGPATYEWDAENRLTAINQGTNRTEFGYDGLGRRVRIIEKLNGVTVTNSSYVWCGTEVCEQRDASGTNVLARYFYDGEQNLSQSLSLYYTRDHLGSVRDVTDASGALVTRYDYGPYGEQTSLQENQPATFGYSGHFLHRPSKLNLTLYRPFSSATGRWLTRDPAGESAGLALYSYVNNDPLDLIDPLGLIKWDPQQARDAATDVGQDTAGITADVTHEWLTEARNNWKDEYLTLEEMAPWRRNQPYLVLERQAIGAELAGRVLTILSIPGTLASAYKAINCHPEPGISHYVNKDSVGAVTGTLGLVPNPVVATAAAGFHIGFTIATETPYWCGVGYLVLIGLGYDPAVARQAVNETFFKP